MLQRANCLDSPIKSWRRASPTTGAADPSFRSLPRSTSCTSSILLRESPVVCSSSTPPKVFSKFFLTTFCLQRWCDGVCGVFSGLVLASFFLIIFEFNQIFFTYCHTKGKIYIWLNIWNIMYYLFSGARQRQGFMRARPCPVQLCFNYISIYIIIPLWYIYIYIMQITIPSNILR